MNDSKLFQELVRLRRKIHQHPELGNQEFQTAALVEHTLKSLRIPSKRTGKTGVVGLLKGTRPGKCVALRADMDALPLKEQTKTPYCSRVPGVMHACGHDAHVAMLLGAAMLLSKKPDFAGSVKFLFQPNEEGAGGAKSLISNGAMKGPAVDCVFGLHVNPRLPSKVIGLKPGPLMAAVDKFTIEVIGNGGHAAYPHEGVDAVVIASEIVLALQTIVSRKMNPVEPAVVTVGKIEGGTQYNILAGSVTLTGTIRTLTGEAHKRMPLLLKEIVSNLTKAHGATYKIHYEVRGAAVVNSKEMTALARKTAARLFGEKMVADLESPSMGGEDFSEYLKLVPGCFIYLGSSKASEKKPIPWHHPLFDIDETILPVGAQLLEAVAREAL